MVRSNNFTTYGIHNNLERGAIIFFNTLVALSSNIGDTAIIVGTTKYNAIKLHKVLVVIILHLALSDLLLTTFEVLPQIISLICQGWALGDTICILAPNVNIVCLDAACGLTSLLAVYKLLIVVYPLKSGVWTVRRAHFLCGVMWGIGFLQPARIVCWFFMESGAIYFSYKDYTCGYDLSHVKAPRWLDRFAFYFSYGGLLLVFIILISTSVLLPKKAYSLALNRGQNLRWQGILTVTATTSVYLASNLPWFILSVGGWYFDKEYSVSTWRFVLYISNLNILLHIKRHDIYIYIYIYVAILLTPLHQL